MKIDILFEDKDILVINKPSGLMVHSDGKTEKPTLTDWIVSNYPELKGIGEPMMVEDQEVDRPGIVHRLDEETSGALVIAKTKESFEYLKDQFKNRDIQKEYHAFVWGHFKEASGVVDVSIGRNKNDFRRWHAGRGTRGDVRDAVTKWQAISQFEDENGDKFSLVHLYPKTGRTHQLRVHLKYLQRPIVSDHLYAPTKPDALGFARVALHARKITFTSLNGQELSIEAPYEADFEAALAKYVNL